MGAKRFGNCLGEVGGGELAELSQNGEKFGRWVRVEWDGVVGVE